MPDKNGIGSESVALMIFPRSQILHLWRGVSLSGGLTGLAGDNYHTVPSQANH